MEMYVLTDIFDQFKSPLLTFVFILKNKSDH